MRLFALLALTVLGTLVEASKIPFLKSAGPVDLPCIWDSHAGARFDLNPLTATGDEKSFTISDGDLPCTSEIEPTYSYVWNFCALVTKMSFPTVCDPSSQQGAVLQYLNRADGYKECNVIGSYDVTQDDSHYRLLDSSDPSKGVSITYPMGDKCPEGEFRSATIDVQCADVDVDVEAAQEPSYCQYHMVMRSFYGCPLECPITSKGLCDGHGHCAYDFSISEAYCFCDDGFTGANCAQRKAAPSVYDGHSVQVGLLVTLLVVVVLLLGVVGYMVYRLTMDRKQQELISYSSLPRHGGLELSEHNY